MQSSASNLPCGPERASGKTSGIPSAVEWLPVCAAMLVKWSHQFLLALTVVEEIASDSANIEAVGFEPDLIQTMEKWGNADFRVSLQAV